MGRQRFVCIKCDLRVSGRLLEDGRLVASDRGPDDDTPVQPFICRDCGAVAPELQKLLNYPPVGKGR